MIVISATLAAASCLPAWHASPRQGWHSQLESGVATDPVGRAGIAVHGAVHGCHVDGVDGGELLAEAVPGWREALAVAAPPAIDQSPNEKR